jgi:hypothetical protein
MIESARLVRLANARRRLINRLVREDLSKRMQKRINKAVDAVVCMRGNLIAEARYEAGE